uniref:Uncharacterized protein n=1 Tax=Trichogramma kaykai TaxID=54128 RepID=A0ABD2XN94_9HYME
MDYIIDMQGYICPEFEFLPKEIAIVPLMRHSASSWVIAPPNHYHTYEPSVKKCIDFYSRKVHGIRWSEGSVSGDELCSEIKNLMLSANNIYTYVDSSAKVEFLEWSLGRNVLNLCNYLCPSSSDLTREFGFKSTCIHHMLKSEAKVHREYQCALNNCRLYKKWVLKVTRDYNDSRDAPDSDTISRALACYLRENAQGDEDEDEDSSDDHGDNDHGECNVGINNSYSQGAAPPAYDSLFPQ